MKGCDQAADHYLLGVGPAAASVQKRLLRQRVSCCVARAQAGVLLRRLKFALPGWAAAESRRGRWERESAQRAAQARAFSGEGHSEERAFFFGAPHCGGVAAGVPSGCAWPQRSGWRLYAKAP